VKEDKLTNNLTLLLEECVVEGNGVIPNHPTLHPLSRNLKQNRNQNPENSENLKTPQKQSGDPG
jgi:hypothetical protein